MVAVKKKSSKKVVRVVRKKKVIKRKDVKASKRKIPYEIIRVVKLPDEVLKKIKDGDKEWREHNPHVSFSWYYSTMGRFRRWFDWLNNSFKILTEAQALDYNLVAQIKERIPKEYHCHIEALTDSYNRIWGQMCEVENNVHNVMRSIYYYHGDKLNIKEEELRFRK